MPFNSTIAEFTTSEDNHADTFNARLNKLLENDNYLNDNIPDTSNLASDPHGNEAHDVNFISDVTNSDISGLNISELNNDVGYITGYNVTNSDISGLNISELNDDANYINSNTGLTIEYLTTISPYTIEAGASAPFTISPSSSSSKILVATRVVGDGTIQVGVADGLIILENVSLHDATDVEIDVFEVLV